MKKTAAKWPLSYSVWLYCIPFLTLLSPQVLAQPTDLSAYNRLQAAYIFKIANYVAWPNDQSFSDFSICVVEDDSALSLFLRDAIGKRKIGKRDIQVISLTTSEFYSAAESLGLQCQMVYLNQEVSPEALAPKLKQMEAKPAILWVASPNITTLPGVLFDLVVENGRIVIYINKVELSQSGLSISAALLSVARPR
jgi:hypothetical protein